MISNTKTAKNSPYKYVVIECNSIQKTSEPIGIFNSYEEAKDELFNEYLLNLLSIEEWEGLEIYETINLTHKNKNNYKTLEVFGNEKKANYWVVTICDNI